ncbi:probable calcium-binding protein CML46 [Rutidosis leptorrhynchoides]|uniref:probable calcium-binding protein CML46 n=1 Tax=Rutidosis leptorrhynchoides TaxID=125765 RepID=UPI003A99CC80
MSFMIVEFIQYFFSHIIPNMIMYSNFSFFLDDSKVQGDEKKNQDSIILKRMPSFYNESVRGYEVEMVMSNLGIFCNKGESLPKSLSSNDLFNMFEEQKPQLDEVKEAFDVFDENKDGFIDARELHSVLSALGLKEKAAMDDCKKMIRVFDKNNDGRMDFDEFVKFMESTFC